MEFKPHEYQQYCIDALLERPCAGLFLDMGLGKTVITLTALQELRYGRFQTRKALIIAPKKVAEATWEAERRKWDHLRGLRLSHVLGTLDQRKKALTAPADVYIINRENVVWLVEHLRGGLDWDFDTVVLDESSSFKSYRSKRFRALRKVRPKISRLVLLTGTPAPHGLEDLWSQVYLLDGGQRLGRTISAYREIWFRPGARSATQIFSYVPKKGADKEIYAAISDICVSMKASDYLSMPEIIYDDVPVALDAAARRSYDLLERDMLLQVDEESLVVAGTAGVLTGKLLQLCNGAIYDEKGQVRRIHDAKLDVFSETLEQLQEEHALVFYQFRHDLERLEERLAKDKVPYRVYRGPKDADDWNAGRIRVLLAHPASCGYGLNLQQGGRHVIWFGLTWALEQYQQANARLYRQGQERPVIVHHLVVRGGMDEDVMAALQDKRGTQDALLDALRARVDRARGGAHGETAQEAAG